MIRCVVVDDEKPARDELIFLIEQSGEFQVVETFDSGQKFLAAHPKCEVVFLDIHMPGLSGIETAEILVHQIESPQIIFVTAYDEFAVKAFEVNAIDYILKPVSEERILKTLEKVKILLKKDSNLQVKSLFQSMMKAESIEQICLHHDGKIIPVKLEEIIFVQATNKGVTIYSTKGKFYTNHKLKDIEDIMNNSTLLRCHRSFIINTDYIEHIEPWFNRTYNVLLREVNDKIPISRHYVQAFNEIMHIT
ncbi:MAG: response regulator transcription factor [Clostridia bacterium]|nr:response regulator transcription factor [Clostridia bacterium]